MVTIFRSIGWNAPASSEGGYRSGGARSSPNSTCFRGSSAYRVLCGATGSAKSRILQAIGALGEQIVDLEALRLPQGFGTGVLPDALQPP